MLGDVGFVVGSPAVMAVVRFHLCWSCRDLHAVVTVVYPTLRFSQTVVLKHWYNPELVTR